DFKVKGREAGVAPRVMATHYEALDETAIADEVAQARQAQTEGNRELGRNQGDQPPVPQAHRRKTRIIPALWRNSNPYRMNLLRSSFSRISPSRPRTYFASTTTFLFARSGPSKLNSSTTRSRMVCSRRAPM